MKGINALKKEMLGIPLSELTKLALFLDLRISKMEKMKGIDALKNKCLIAILLLIMLVGDI